MINPKYFLFIIAILEVCLAVCDFNCINCNNSINICTKCGNNKVLFDSKCLDSCPLTYFDKDNVCLTCNNPCRECQENADKCITCQNPLWFLFEGECLQQCPKHTIPTYNDKQSQCSKCNTNCLSCIGNPDNCTSCQDSQKSLYLGQCIHTCPLGSFAEQISITPPQNQCSMCMKNCQSCNNIKQCILCFQGFFLTDDGSQCIDKCPEGYHQDVIYKRCYRTSCPNGTFDITFTENTNSSYKGVKCSTTCPQGYYIDSVNKKCLQCHDKCKECTGPHESDCLSKIYKQIVELFDQKCHKTCLTCAGHRFDQCLSCSSDRQLNKKFNQPVGECVCDSHTTEILRETCDVSDQSINMRNALTGLTATNFILSVVISFFTQNSIFVLRYIDFSQTLSYLGYVTFKYPIQMDRILKIYDHFNLGYLLPKPIYMADSVVISNVQLQNNPYDSQLVYKGNPLFFVNERVPFLIINCFSYFMIYIILIIGLIILRFIIYPITYSVKVKKISEKLPHTLLLNVFILTSQEMITHTFIQFTNIQYKNHTGLSIFSTVVAVLFSIIILGVLIYLSYRTKRKLNFELEEEVFDVRNKLVRDLKQQNGLPCHFQLSILIRKVFYSISVAFLYEHPRAQAAIFFVFQIFMLSYYFFKKPLQQSKFRVIALFIELSFFFFCFLMMINVFLENDHLVTAFSAFGVFLILFQCIICLIGGYYFLMIAIKLIKLREILEMQELQKQYDSIKRLQYQDQENQKKNNNFYQDFGQDVPQNASNIFQNISPDKSLINNQLILLDLTQQQNSSSLFGNQSMVYRNNLNDSQIIQNKSIINQKSIDEDLSPSKYIHHLHPGFQNQNNGQENSPVRKMNLRKQLPPINEGFELEQNGYQTIIAKQNSQNSESMTGSILQKKSNIVVSEDMSFKNNSQIKKKVHQLQNSIEPSPQNKQIVQRKDNYATKEETDTNSFLAGSISNTSKAYSGRESNIFEMSHQKINNNNKSGNYNTQSNVLSLNQKQNQNIELIKDVEESSEQNDSDYRNNIHEINENSQNQQNLFLKAKNKEITIKD